ncbi:MAG TPA: hypothetical protein VEK06_02090 [Myxococcota bacterium]|nr:hypothetical protein [Myxococcota bacterium]
MAKVASSAAKTRKKTVTSSATKSKSASKRGPSKLFKSLPESVENIEIVQQVAGILEEMQSRVKDVKQEASKELKKLMKLYEGNYKNLEKKVHQVTSEAKKQAQVGMIHILQKWHEHKEKLPAPLANEVEKIVAQIGTKAMARKKASPAPKSGSRESATTRKPRTVSSVRKPAQRTRKIKETKTSEGSEA